MREVPTVSKPDAELPESGNDRLAQFIDRERIRLLHRNNGVVLLATGLLAVLICLTLRTVVDGRVLLGWLVIYVLVTVLRFAAFLAFRKSPDRFSDATWHRIFVLGAALAGSAWGLAAILFFVPDQPDYMLLLTCLYAVVVAVGSQALNTSMPAFLWFSMTMILPLMGTLVAAGGDFYRPLGLIGFLYLFAISAFAVNNHKSVMDAIRLRFENRELVDRLSEQKAAADASRQEAESANLAKSRFLAAASHDLRQPLHALGLFQNALEMHVHPGGEQIMHRMKASIDALGGLFDGLLDISKLDAGVVDVHPRSIMLEPLLSTLAAEFRAEAEEKGLSLERQTDDVCVRADPVMLERILRNLLSNAIRYTDSGRVRVVAFRQGEEVQISVEDTGRGIPEEDWENIFSEYHQLRTSDRDRAKGFGLGLAIVHRLCRLMDARLTMTSKQGQGSVFTIALPIGSGTKHEVPTSLPAWDLRGATILVIDDEPDILESMTEVLARWGCRTLAATSLADAMRAVDSSEQAVTAIVADYRLGDSETGIDAVARIREEVNDQVPAILVSGDTAPDRLKEVAESGLRLLHKPVSPAALRTALFQEVVSYRSEPDRDA